MASEQSSSTSKRSYIVILNEEGLPQCQITARPKVSKGAENGALNGFAETGSVVFKARSVTLKVTTPSEDQ